MLEARARMNVRIFLRKLMTCSRLALLAHSDRRLQEVLAVLEARAKMDAERNARNSMAAINLRNKVRCLPDPQPRSCRRKHCAPGSCDTCDSVTARP